MQIIYQDSKSKVQNVLVDDLVKVISKQKQNKLLLFYSGGSVLELFPLLLEKLTENGINQLNAWFVPIDERFDQSASNYQALRALECYSKYEKMGVRFLDVLTHGHSLEDSGYWFSEWVRVETDQVHIGGGNVISILGMGPDGHTAGLFPYPENEVFFTGEFIDTMRYATAYDVGNKNQYRERITTTYPALRAIDITYCYVIGENKKEALQRVLSDSGSVAETPAKIWRKLQNVTIFTDIFL